MKEYSVGECRLMGRNDLWEKTQGEQVREDRLNAGLFALGL